MRRTVESIFSVWSNVAVLYVMCVGSSFIAAAGSLKQQLSLSNIHKDFFVVTNTQNKRYVLEAGASETCLFWVFSIFEKVLAIVVYTNVKPMSEIDFSCLVSQITPDSLRTVTLYFVIFVITNVVWCAICILYVVGSKSFWPDQLFKVTEMKQLCYFST